MRIPFMRTRPALPDGDTLIESLDAWREDGRVCTEKEYVGARALLDSGLEVNVRYALDRAHAVLDAIERCVCNVGVLACPEHPGRMVLRSKEEKIEFRKQWDRRVEDA